MIADIDAASEASKLNSVQIRLGSRLTVSTLHSWLMYRDFCWSSLLWPYVRLGNSSKFVTGCS